MKLLKEIIYSNEGLVLIGVTITTIETITRAIVITTMRRTATRTIRLGPHSNIIWDYIY